VSQATVAKYMVRHRKPQSQPWRTFLGNHVKQLVSVDFFVVPTVIFRILNVFICCVREPGIAQHSRCEDRNSLYTEFVLGRSGYAAGPAFMKKTVQIDISLALTAAIGYLVYRGATDWGQALRVMLRGRSLMLLAGILLVLVHMLLRALHWGVLLSPVRRGVSFRNLFSLTVVKYVVNIIPPRTDEVAASVVLARKEAVPVASVISASLLERILDMMAVLFLFGVYVVGFQFFMSIAPCAPFFAVPLSERPPFAGRRHQQRHISRIHGARAYPRPGAPELRRAELGLDDQDCAAECARR